MSVLPKAGRGLKFRRGDNRAGAVWLRAGVASSAFGPRVQREWTALVAVPLLMTATALAGMWTTWPILLFASWWWLPLWRWSWLIVTVEGPFGAQWAYSGATGFATFPNHFAVIAVVWIIVPALIAASFYANRRFTGRFEWQPPI